MLKTWKCLSLSTLKWPFILLILNDLQEQFFLKTYFKCTFNTIKQTSFSQEDRKLTITICVHLPEDLIRAFLRCGLILWHLHHWRNHLIDGLRKTTSKIKSKSALEKVLPHKKHGVVQQVQNSTHTEQDRISVPQPSELPCCLLGSKLLSVLTVAVSSQTRDPTLGLFNLALACR